MNAPGTPSDSVVESALERSGAPWRKVAPGEWGLGVEAGGWPLDVGLARRAGLLRAQAEVLGPGVADAAAVLHRNRRLVIVRFAAASSGAVWIQGEIPVSAAMHAHEVDRLLGLVLEAAEGLRAAYAARR